MNFMKTFLTLIAFSFLISISTTCAQDVIADPDFSGKPYYFRDGKLNEFEKAEAILERKVKGMGYGGVEFFYSVGGLKSTTRFIASSIPKIIVKNEDNSDPTEMLLVCIGETKKDNRRFKSFKVGTFGGTKGISDNRIRLTVKKIRDKVFEISIDQTLTAGEYAILPYSKEVTAAAATTGVKVNCFGVD